MTATENSRHPADFEYSGSLELNMADQTGRPEIVNLKQTATQMNELMLHGAVHIQIGQDKIEHGFILIEESRRLGELLVQQCNAVVRDVSEISDNGRNGKQDNHRFGCVSVLNHYHSYL